MDKKTQNQYRKFIAGSFKSPPESSIVRRDDNRTVLRIDNPLGDGQLFVKKYHYKGFDFRLKMLTGRLGAMHDAKIIRSLSAAGFNVPPLVAAFYSSIWPDCSFARSSVLAVAWLEGFYNLAEFFQHTRGSDKTEFNRCLGQIGAFAARLHDSGFRIKDLNPGNILLRAECENFDLHLVDYESVHLQRLVTGDRRIKNLIQLAAALALVTPVAAAPLCEAYQKFSQQPMPQSLSELVADGGQKLRQEKFTARQRLLFRAIEQKMNTGERTDQ